MGLPCGLPETEYSLLNLSLKSNCIFRPLRKDLVHEINEVGKERSVRVLIRDFGCRRSNAPMISRNTVDTIFLEARFLSANS